MTKAQYLAVLKKFNLSIVGASVFGLSRRQCQRLAAGDSPIPKPLAHLLRLMLRLNIKPADLEKDP